MFKQVSLYVIALSVLCTLSSLADAPVKLLPDENSIYCVTGQTLEITGQVVSSAGFDHSMMTEGGTILDTHDADASNKDTYSYLWRATKPGTHYLQIRYVLPNGNMARARRISVVVLDDAPLTVSPLPDQSVTDVAISGTGASSTMSPVRVECFLDGISIGTGDVKSSVFTLPLYKADSGPHTAYIQAVDSNGMRFVSSPQIITVPERVMLTIPLEVSLAHLGDPVPFTVALAPGVKIARLTYSIGRVIPAPQAMVARRMGLFGPTVYVPAGPPAPAPPPAMQNLDTVATQPYSDAVTMDNYPTGDYQVQAAAATDDGTVYQSQPIKVHFVNQVEDDREAKQKAAAAAQASAAEGAMLGAVLGAVLAPRDEVDVTVRH